MVLATVLIAACSGHGKGNPVTIGTPGITGTTNSPATVATDGGVTNGGVADGNPVATTGAPTQAAVRAGTNWSSSIRRGVVAGPQGRVTIEGVGPGAVAGSPRVRPNLPLLGFNTFLSLPGAFGPADVARAAASVGPGTVIRFPVSWFAVQPHCLPSDSPYSCSSPQAFDWTPYDSALAVLHDYPVSLLPIPWAAPPWAWSPYEQPLSYYDAIMPPADTNFATGAFASCAAALVHHLKATGWSGRIVGLEVWSEENGVTSWTSNAGPDPARYARLFCRTSMAVRAGDRSLPIIFGGMGAPAKTQQGVVYTLPDFLSAAYAAAPIASCATSIGVHAGTDAAYPPDDPRSGFLPVLDQARAVTAAYGDSARPLAITEFGYYSLVGLNTSQQQADRDVQGYLMAAKRSDVPLVIINTLFDLPNQARGHQPLRYGVFAGPQQPRPAADALKKTVATGAPTG
jgi:hypothetical protein